VRARVVVVVANGERVRTRWICARYGDVRRARGWYGAGIDAVEARCFGPVDGWGVWVLRRDATNVNIWHGAKDALHDI
jgi:hypothetical protein